MMQTPMPAPALPRAPRGYALLMVVIGGVILSVLAVTLLRATGMNRADAARQTNSVKALYAAESAVAVGVDNLRQRLEVTPNPSLVSLTAPVLPGVSFDRYEVGYVNPNNNYAPSTTACAFPDNTPCGTGTCSVDNVCRYTTNGLLTSGDYAGLTALQIPIQVLASVDVNSAKATVADIVQLNLIPIFQFGIFFDGDLPFSNPGDMQIQGAVHTNGKLVPYRSGTSSHLDFERQITVADYISQCRIFSPGSCLGTSNGVRIRSPISTNLDTLQYGREDYADDATWAGYLETRYGDRVKDKSRGVVPLNPPLRVSGAIPPVVGRPASCGTLASYAAPQGAGIEIIRRPTGGYSDGGNASTSGYSLEYGPTPTANDGITADGVNGLASPLDNCTATSAGRAHCQTVARSVPRLSMTQASDDPGVATERFYWKAHIRIIDGIWYRADGTVIFDPEDWDLTGAAAVTDASFRRAMKYARVTRYSWFWDPRENRQYDTTHPNYASVDRYHRAVQIRTTDFDVFAFKMLLKDGTAVSEIFGGSGIPADGVIVYVSETYDPRWDDENYTGPRPANVRNFLNFHVMENTAAGATACFNARSSPARGAPAKTPCRLGFHPYYIWGDGADTLETGAYYSSLTPNPADLRQPDFPDPTVDAGYKCHNPLKRTARSFSLTDTAPCVEAGATPTGPENAVRVVRATHMPEDAVGNKIGFTLATDNRLYLYGDVNTNTAGNQGLAGKVSFIADSITLLSQRFSDRIMQRGANGGSWQPSAYYRSHSGQPNAVHFGVHPGGVGDAPNLCNAWNQTATGTFRAREPLDLRVYASLLMGDVPDCPNAGTGAGANSGGVNNFPRFLEDFRLAGSTYDVLIRGSIVSLFRSQLGNARFPGSQNSDPSGSDWVAGPRPSPYDYNGEESCTYSAPSRDWGFDSALLTPANLPPGTPRLVQVDRVRWVRR